MRARREKRVIRTEYAGSGKGSRQSTGFRVGLVIPKSTRRTAKGERATELWIACALEDPFGWAEFIVSTMTASRGRRAEISVEIGAISRSGRAGRARDGDVRTAARDFLREHVPRSFQD